jgi:hypothetical protein
LHEIVNLERVLHTYIQEAVAVEKAGLKVVSSALMKAFHALTPGRQRCYLLHFFAAKQSKTRAARIEKNVDRILEAPAGNLNMHPLRAAKPRCKRTHQESKAWRQFNLRRNPPSSCLAGMSS